MVQLDATYKVVWQGCPLMVFGTSDHNQVFHPYGLAVCNAESTEDFRFIFQSLHNFDLEWKPSVLLGDGCDRITKGYVEVFGEPRVRLMCFFHVSQNVEKYIKVLPRELGLRVKEDIRVLQTCTNEETFTKATDLFLKKWKGAEVADLTTYFRTQ